MSLYSLPLELLLLIPPNLQYASDLNAISQTCRLFHTIFNPQLYSIFAASCEPNILRLVANGNFNALQKLVSAGYRLFDFLETPGFWWDVCCSYEWEPKSSSMMTAARNGHVEILQMFIDKLPSTVKKFAHRSSRLLSVAATHGQLDVVKCLIAHGIPTGYGFTPGRSTLDSLQDAVKGGHLPVLEYLLDEGTCKDSQDLVDLLDHATSGCHLEIVKYLVKRGADFICPLSGYPSKYRPDSIFEYAVNMGHEDIASFFLQSAPPELLNDISISGWYSMLRPCRRDEVPYSCPSPWGKPHLAQMILDRVDLETQLATTTAPEQANLLAVAAETGNVALTQRLLDKGCRPDLSNMRLTPVSRAVNNGHAEIIEACVRCPGYPVSQFDIASAAKKGETAIVLRLLDKLGRKDYKSFAKVALNAASHLDKFLPVMESVFDALYKKDVKTVVSMATSFTGPQASCVGHLEVTKFLLEKGRQRPFDEIPKYLDVVKRRWKEPTTLLEHAAAVCPVPQFQAALAQWNFELDPDDGYCKDALVAAALHKKVETIRLFIERGFDVKSTYLHRGKLLSLLHLVVETLVDDYGRVIDVDDEKAQVRQRYKPNGHPWLDHVHPRASIQLLIEHGAEIDQVDSHGRTALFLATEIRTLVLAKELLRLGANPVFSRPGKVSPLELAISQGQTKYVKAFLKAMEARSFACDNFVSLIPDVPPVEMLPNRASHDRFSVSSRNLLPQRGMLARDGHMGPTITIPSPSGEIDRRDSTSSEDISTDDETIRAGPPTSEDNFLSIWPATEDDECVGDLRWVRFFIAKAMTQHHWRMMYPVPV